MVTHVLIAAKGALNHVGDPERKAKIKAAFLCLHIPESEYLVLAGFDEDSDFGYLEEIHVFCRVEIRNFVYQRSCLLSKLGKIFAPYCGCIFTPSSRYEIPVFKDDGTRVWDDNCPSTKPYSDLCVKGILNSESKAFTILAENQPSCPEESRGDDNGSSFRWDPSNPGISFDVEANLFRNSESSPFQKLGTNGTLTVQTFPGRLRPRQVARSRVEFRKLNFRGSKSADPVYEQIHARVEINTQNENTHVHVLQPHKTRAYDLQETPSGMELRKNHSRITERHISGAVSWGFTIDMRNERKTGIEFGKHRLPSVNFDFFGWSDFEPPPPPPECFDVLVKSWWSLIPPHSRSDGTCTCSGWFPWSQAESAASKIPLYSNLCQLVILDVPSDLSQVTAR